MFRIETKSQIFFSSCMAFILGNVAFGFFKNGVGVFICGVIVFLCSLFVYNKKKLVLLFALLYFCAVTLFSLEYNSINTSSVKDFVGLGEVHEVQAVISDEPIIKDATVKLKIKPTHIDQFVVQNSKAELILYTDAFDQYQFGDQLIFEGKIEELPTFEDFDYRAFSLKDGIVGAVYSPYIISVQDGDFSYQRKIYSVKNSINATIQKNITEPESAFLAGLLIGDRAGLSERVTEAFKRTGMTHIVAISGYNIAIVVVIFSRFGNYFLKRQYVFIIILLSLAVFVVLTGSSASVVRAAIMGSIILYAMYVGRVAGSRNLLAFTAVVMAIFNPFVLLYDVGFQLSFFSTLGILYFADFFEKKLLFIPRVFALRESLSLTLIAQIVTLPITLLNFKALSVISVVANILVAPLIPLAMLFGAMGVGVSFVPIISRVFFFISYTFLYSSLRIIEGLSPFSFSWVDVYGTLLYSCLFLWMCGISILVYVKEKYEKND